MQEKITEFSTRITDTDIKQALIKIASKKLNITSKGLHNMTHVLNVISVNTLQNLAKFS